MNNFKVMGTLPNGITIMSMAQKGAEMIKSMATKIFDIMSEFNYYDTEESDVTEVEENLIYDPYAIIDSLTEIIDRLSNDLNIEREKVDFAISEATKKIKAETEVKCDNTELYKCSVNGKLLSLTELGTIADYFIACEYAEVLANEHDVEASEEERILLGHKIHYALDVDANLTENHAIVVVLEERRKERIKQIHNTLCDMYGELFNIADDSEIENELKYLQDSIKAKDKFGNVEFI